MAIAWIVTINKVTVFGDQRVSYCTLTTPASGSNTYTTGGDSVTPAQVGLDYIDFTDSGVALASGAATGYVSNITLGTGANAAMKIQLFTSNGAAPAALAELASNTAVASFTLPNVEFRGV